MQKQQFSVNQLADINTSRISVLSNKNFPSQNFVFYSFSHEENRTENVHHLEIGFHWRVIHFQCNSTHYLRKKKVKILAQSC